ncbi:hypothetical protein Cch01nite_19640 [Cellulomonas chitinilytica]|uniref:Uncharacterized protein n=1 Tax=Cellulomonas chitinilytica TaxID=398759 RepID=A0A919P2W2_9CELL|nr:hypothetical protein [Cellulomonas chitinilytica]GIG21240.1 hypothetical protein Cch01nite_19640 [Cellulomonas chitinilytica]
MLPDDLLVELLPREPPQYAGRQVEASTAGEYLLGAWTQVIRGALEERARYDDQFARDVRRAVFVGIGVFRAPWRSDGFNGPFRVVHGYQFGVALLSAHRPEPRTEIGAFGEPIRQMETEFRWHGSPPDEGRIAAYFEDGGDLFGVTARHVVDGLPAGRRAPVSCEHGTGTTMVRGGGPYVDAATVRLGCTVRPLRATGGSRSARAGEQVCHHFDSGLCTTKIVELQSTTQFRSAVMPQHFLTDDHGHPADSGALVSSAVNGDMCGIYLGECTARDPDGSLATYGFGLDLPQALDVLGITSPLAGATHA